MDGLEYDISEYDIEAASDDESLVVRQQISGFIPSSTFENSANPNDSSHDVPIPHSSSHSSPPRVSGDISSFPPPSHGNNVYLSYLLWLS